MSSRRGASGPVTIDLLELSREGIIHFVGIGGSGMSALAEMVVRSGGTVTGCDRAPSDATRALEALGVEIVQGHDPAHVASAAAIVTTAAVPNDHPELLEARRRGVPVLKRASALGAIVNSGRVIGIAGTHGKTTTTAMATAILSAAGMEPTGLVGGRVPGWGGGLRMGGQDIFVVEADEYDRSFLTLRPHVAVVTTIEADHLDIYGSLEAIQESFRDFVSQVAPGGLLVTCHDDAGARALAEEYRGPAVTYGTDRNATIKAVDIEMRGLGSRFRVVADREELGEVRLGTPGLHNIRNALAAIAAARHVGADIVAARTALGGFRGVARRFQELGVVDGITVVDDYAHHPTEVEATLVAARSAYPGRRLVAVFQPHLYSRTRDFATEFGRALSTADAIWVTDIYAAREAPIAGITGEMIVTAARHAGASEVRFHPAVTDLPAALAAELRPGDVCFTLGAGDIDSAARALLESRNDRAGGVA